MIPERELNIYTQWFAHYCFLYYSHKSGFNVLKAVLSQTTFLIYFYFLYVFMSCFHLFWWAEIWSSHGFAGLCVCNMTKALHMSSINQSKAHLETFLSAPAKCASTICSITSIYERRREVDAVTRQIIPGRPPLYSFLKGKFNRMPKTRRQSRTHGTLSYFTGVKVIL